MTISLRLSTRSWRCYQAQIWELSVKRKGAVRNKLMSFHSNMSEARHKKAGFRDEMMVSSGIKTRAFMTVRVSDAEDCER